MQQSLFYNMIVILSYSSYEQGTEGVIDWLVYYKAKFLKITHEDFYQKDKEILININDRKVYYKNIDITNYINIIFYRRLFNTVNINNNGGVFKDQLVYELTDELDNMIYYLIGVLAMKKWIPSPYMVNVNKLTIVNRALQSGLKVPETRIINNKKDLIDFYGHSNEKVITKPINKSGYFSVDKNTYFSNVNSIDAEFIKKLPNNFFPSLFQQRVLKQYEIRVFYFEGKFYNVAMIHTGVTQDVDIKIAHQDGNGHWVPYKLPKKVEISIDKFMKKNMLTTGSIDLIKSTDENYYFIEVNPVGQYGAPSYYGNFELEKMIAEYLIKNDDL